MRILSLSDIHGNLDAFNKALEVMVFIDFDVIVVAGDMGMFEEAEDILYELAGYPVPIVYVQGNWDCFEYTEAVDPHAEHIHLKHRCIDDWIFLGYSGSVADYYMGHPTLSDSLDRYNKLPEKTRGSYYSFCQNQIRQELNAYIDAHKLDESRIVFVSHERIYRLPFKPRLYLFGHEHRPKHTRSKQTDYVNTSAVEMASIMNDLPPDRPGSISLSELTEDLCKVEFHEVPSPYILQAMTTKGAYQVLREANGTEVGCYYQSDNR